MPTINLNTRYGISVGTAELVVIDSLGNIVNVPSVTTPGNIQSATLSTSGAATIGGNLIIGGNLTINGTTETVNSTIVNIADVNIQLGAVATPTDTTAIGGGITLMGASNKTITWNNSNAGWQFSENISMPVGKQFLIDGAVVLNTTSLGTSVLSSSLTSVGTLTSLIVAGAVSAASIVSNGTISSAGNLTLSGTGVVDLYTSGDIQIYRAGGTTAVIMLNSNGQRYLSNDGTNYNLAGQGLIVGGLINGTSFTGAGTGLTGTASSLSIGGNAATSTTSTNLVGGTVNATTLSSNGMSNLGNSVTQGAPSATNILATASATIGGAGGNYLSFGQYTNYNQWIQSSFNNPTSAVYNLLLQPIGGNVGIGMSTSPISMLQVNGTVTATAFTGAGTGLTGTAAALSIGGTATNQSGGTVNATTGTFSGTISGNVGQVNTGINAIGQYDFVSGSGSTWYNAGWRNDGNAVYLLTSAVVSTQTAAKTTSFNNFRPFAVNLSSGNITIDGTGIGVSFGGSINAGIWNGSAIPLANGGTGASSQTTALTNLMPSGATSGYVLTTSGAGSYYWAAPTGSTAPVGTTIQSSRTLVTATAGQTVFATPTYIPGASQLRIYINGIRQFSTEYSETSSTSFTLTAPGAALNDVVFIEVDGYVTFALTAIATTFTPTGLITSTNVQAAIADLEARKASHTDSVLIGTTSIALNRSSAAQTLTGISIDGNAATATNAVLTTTQVIGDNSTKIASTAFVQANIVLTKPFTTGTRTSFNQTTAPTGWTKDTTAALNDSAMRIVTGTVGSGGSYALSGGCTVVAAHTHGWSGTSNTVSNDHTHSGSTGTESALHNHTIPSLYFSTVGGPSGILYGAVNGAAANPQSWTENQYHTHAFTTGGISANHTHTVSGTTADSNNSGVWIPKYYDFIIATIN